MSINIQAIAGEKNARIITTQDEPFNHVLVSHGFENVSHGDGMILWIVPAHRIVLSEAPNLDWMETKWVEFGEYRETGKITIERTANIMYQDLIITHA